MVPLEFYLSRHLPEDMPSKQLMGFYAFLSPSKINLPQPCQPSKRQGLYEKNSWNGSGNFIKQPHPKLWRHPLKLMYLVTLQTRARRIFLSTCFAAIKFTYTV